MAEIRLSKLSKQFGIGLGTLVEFLESKNIAVENNPNAKVSDEIIPDLEAKFGADLKAKLEADKVSTKLKEMIEGPSAKKAKEDEEEFFEKPEIIIKSNLTSAQTIVKEEEKKIVEPVVKEVRETEIHAEKLSGPKVLNKIDLDAIGKKKARKEEQVAPEPAAAPEPEKKIEPAVKAEPEHVAAPAAEPAALAVEKVAAPATEKAVAAEPETKVIVDKSPAAQKLAGPKVVDKIDLSQFEHPAKNKKRERIQVGGSQKVDVTKVDIGNQNNRKDKNRNDRNQGKKGKGGNDRFRPALSEAELEEQQKEIQKQIKETYARMNEGKGKNNFGAKYRKEKRDAVAEKMQEEIQQAAAEDKTLKVTEFVTVNELATLMNVPVTKVIGACMNLGLMVSINQRLDAEYLVMVAEEFGFKVEFITASLNEAIEDEDEDDKPEDMVSRPPVITVMGHVDHGKTSLLDYIRKSNVIAGEAGGITQHIGAYHVEMPDGQKITFLDTPGHEAFTAMRARGAKMTDLAIIIVAADDCVMPQTVEAINHAQAAGVPMVFAINKIDKDGANPEKIREQLSGMNILVEDWGGKYQCQEISAKKGLNVDKLLDKVLLEAEMLELKANPKKRASGAVIESSLDKGRGYLATVLVQSGTMRVGDVMLSGPFTGRIKAMYNERGQKVDQAGPSVPVSVLGLNGAPTAGETFNIMADEREAKDIASKREQLLRIQGIKTQKHTTLDDIARRIAIGNFKELNVIVKGDVDGSIEALSDSLIKLSTEEVVVNVIHKAVGAISESDVLLAAASDAVIIGFQVRPSADARKLAEKEQIEIRLYSVIYDAINEIKSGIEGMLAPEEKEEILGTAEVKETFKISKVGTIAGCIVKEGKIQRVNKVRVIRDGIVVYTGELGSLKRFKDDAKEVLTGMDCGLNIDNFNDIKIGDQVEAYQIVEIKRTL
ncbi:MAG: translation initiation factor IF-2 [Bacteroidales bacterium]|nr:translation initiation factor IF-2 [Candidatus Hennigimonas equi]